MRVHGRRVDVWNGQFTRPLDRQFSISLCTTCMGRANDLAQTLPKNIADNADYPHLEFVVLDYNSQDGLEQWIKENMMPYVESGRLVYAKTTEPKWYQMAHSRNVAFKLASGEIVCNVDADNWTGPGFASVLNRLANERQSRAVFTKGRQLIRGRLAFYKQEWEKELGGYDETLQHYGHDDMDLMYRALLQGFRLMWFGKDYVERIRTGSLERVQNMAVKNWRHTEKINRAVSDSNIERGLLKSNEGRTWGAAVVQKNFTENLFV